MNNIFIMTNINSIDELAALFQAIGQPARLQILLALAEGEACVCHLEALFGWRQAYISQHLMALREAGLVTDRRESRFIYYRLADVQLPEVIRQVAEMRAVTLPELQQSSTCECPKCSSRRGECCK
jgi:DNA-binding transcriptional ArsR family regulator